MKISPPLPRAPRFPRAFKIDALSLPGKTLASFGSGEWNSPQLATLLKATASGHADIEGYEMDLRRPGEPGRCLVVNAKKLRYGASGPIRLLLTVADVTEARIAERLKDDLLRDKAILLQEFAASRRQQPANHRQRADAERPPCAIRRNQKPFA